MDRPYIICHMLTSIDGKVTGDFLLDNRIVKATNIYYQINRDFKADGFLCGRVTMEESFTGGYFPSLEEFSCENIDYSDYVAFKADLYAVAIDRYGKLGWKNSHIIDEDPGYGNSHIIEVLTETVKKEYLAYLRSINVSYIIAGKADIDIKLALHKLKILFGINKLLLEGGSIINGVFLKANVIDELSIVVANITANKDDKSLFYDGDIEAFNLIDIKRKDDIIILNYKK